MKCLFLLSSWFPFLQVSPFTWNLPFYPCIVLVVVYVWIVPPSLMQSWIPGRLVFVNGLLAGTGTGGVRAALAKEWSWHKSVRTGRKCVFSLLLCLLLWP